MEQAELRLADFGMARDQSENLAMSTVGTPLYMAPEVLRGARYDGKADLFAAGEILYELCFGVHPFRPVRSSYVELRKNLQRGVIFPEEKATGGRREHELESLYKDLLQQLLVILAIKFVLKK